jgi:hypothetical protein
MSNFAYPSNSVVLNGDGKFTPDWESLFSRMYRIAAAEQDAGPTASRPEKGLWIGRPYYDTSLNFKVYVSAVNPTVWRDGAGVVA